MTDVVRCCKATYSQTLLNEHGIKVHDWIFSDGDPPSKIIIDEWLNLVDSTFKTEQDIYEQEKEEEEDDPPTEKQRPCIAAHCVAGLGRYIKMKLFFYFICGSY